MQPPSLRVWLLVLDRGPTGAAFDLLQQDEQVTCARFAKPRDANAFAQTRAALRCLLGAEINVAPGAVALIRNRWGKPQLREDQYRPGLDFSVSHAGDLALIALSSSGPVGIDLERRHRVTEMDRIAAQVFGEPTAQALHQVPAERRDDVFLALWTAGEACLKAMGLGFAGANGRAPVTMAPDGAPCAEDWDLPALDLPPDYVGAVAVRNAGPLARASPEVTHVSRLIARIA